VSRIINVTAVNDPPSFTKGDDQIVKEGAEVKSIPGWATNITPGPNETSQIVLFEIVATATPDCSRFRPPSLLTEP
jgi:hypothetical protein